MFSLPVTFNFFLFLILAGNVLVLYENISQTSNRFSFFDYAQGIFGGVLEYVNILKNIYDFSFL